MTEVGFVTEREFTTKVALVAPPVMVTPGAKVAIAGLLLDSATIAPPAGAGPLSETVPVVEDAPTTLAGFNDTPFTFTPFGPNMAISAKPILPPAALLIVNCAEVTALGAKDMGNPMPLLGKAPTGTELPSLKVSVPARTLSVRLGLS